MRWAKEIAESPLAPQQTAGPNGKFSVIAYLEAQYG